MYVRLSNVRRGARIYRYVQLVESFRRPDGTPTNRVVANLGALDDLAIENLRAALAASREHKAVVLPDGDAGAARPRAQVHANLRYLDIAVLLHVWRDLDLGRLLETALPRADRTVPASDIITALVLQRCVAPGSKLAAERWYPTTALPELQAIEPGRFNNSRVHRALSALEQGEEALQNALPRQMKSKVGAFTALFIDATDTWFVGQGPPMAEKGRDKEGLYRRRIGLVMLCDQRGFPLRWHTLDGRYHDPTALAEMAREVAALPWTKGVPIAMDRAAGHAGATENLHDNGTLYITALPDSELMSSGVPIPWASLDLLQTEATPEGIRTRLLAAGFTPGRGDRFILDLGVFKKSRSQRGSHVSIATASLWMLDAIEAGPTTAHVAAHMQTSTHHVRRHAHLVSLTAEVRRRIVAEEVDRLNLADLLRIARSAPEKQEALLDSLLAEPGRKRHTSRIRVASDYPARAVISFGPERFLADRQRDQEHVADVEALLVDINRRLAHRSNRRSDGSALAEVEHRLRKHGLGSVFTVQIEGAGAGRRVALVRNEAAWARRRRGDGINVILAHADVPGTGPDLVAQYFAKDAIEKDFQTIKSLIELRPIHHRSDMKVRAHVAVCVLALLLLRALEDRISLSSARALEVLEAVRLNQLVEGKTPFYTVTKPSADAAALLATLKLTDLVDDAKVCGQITPR